MTCMDVRLGKVTLMHIDHICFLIETSLHSELWTLLLYPLVYYSVSALNQQAFALLSSSSLSLPSNEYM